MDRDQDLRFLNVFPDLVNEIKEEVGYEEEDIKEVMDEYFKAIRNSLEDWRCPKVKVKYLGTFQPTSGLLRFRLNSYIRQYREGLINRGKFLEKFRRTYPVYKRILKEEHFTTNSPGRATNYKTWDDYGPVFDPDKLTNNAKD